MELIKAAWDIFVNLGPHLDELAQSMGPGLYALLFFIIFAETGLVVTPFLPGDSLLFAVGALCARPASGMNIGLTVGLLIVAGILGDAVNYAVGYRVGPKVFTREDSIWLNKRHLLHAQSFYERYGGRAIVFARFVPIVRTFAPFVAGIGKMHYRRFAMFNFSGAIAWVCSFTLAGYLFGEVEAVKRNFHIVIVAIIVISVMPAVIEVIRARRANAAAAEKA